jgi:DNA-directed RNA polymerase subunit M/transcription elongation factor TFIIS
MEEERLNHKSYVKTDKYKKSVKVIYEIITSGFDLLVAEKGVQDSIEVVSELATSLECASPELSRDLTCFLNDYIIDHDLCPRCYNNTFDYIEKVPKTYEHPSEGYVRCTECGYCRGN